MRRIARVLRVTQNKFGAFYGKFWGAYSKMQRKLH